MEAQIGGEQMEASRWVFDKITPMQVSMYKTNPLLSGTYVKLPNKNQAILNPKSIHMFLALWSILAFLFPAKTNQDSTANYKCHFSKSDKDGIDSSNGLRIEDIPKLEPKNNLNINVFKLGFNKQTKFL